MATYLNGVNGSVLVATHQVLRIEKWSGTLKIGSIVDLPEFGSTGGLDRAAVGQPSFDGSFSGRCDPSDTTGQHLLMDDCYAGTSIACTFTISATANVACTVFIESVAIDTPATGVVGGTFNFKSTGDITLTLA